MTLNQELAQMKKTFDPLTPLEAQAALSRLIREQQESAAPFGLQVGQKAKDFTLQDALGRAVNLYDELTRGPVVLTFTAEVGALTAADSSSLIRKCCLK